MMHRHIRICPLQRSYERVSTRVQAVGARAYSMIRARPRARVLAGQICTTAQAKILAIQSSRELTWPALNIFEKRRAGHAWCPCCNAPDQSRVVGEPLPQCPFCDRIAFSSQLACQAVASMVFGV